jgi:hypothetical protein
MITTFDATPSASITVGYSLNDSGMVTGYFTDTSQTPNRLRGFIRKHNGTVTVFDGPGASGTTSYSINEIGAVTGYFGDTNKAVKRADLFAIGLGT